MKKTRKRIITAILCSLLASLSLVSCSSEQNDDYPTQATTSQNQQSSQADEEKTEKAETTKEPVQNTDTANKDIEIDTYKEQISYYMELTESLQSDLLKLKEESYISECEYQLQIKSLEQTVQDLKDALSSISGGSLNTNTTPSDINTPSNDQLSAKVDFKYTTTNGEVTITEYTGSAVDVKIPSAINGYPVTKIGEGAFKSKPIRSVEIPSGVRELDWFAFSACTSLETITIPSSVLTVRYGAFDLCPKSLIIKCKKNSYIEAYALSWGMNVEAE